MDGPCSFAGFPGSLATTAPAPISRPQAVHSSDTPSLRISSPQRLLPAASHCAAWAPSVAWGRNALGQQRNEIERTRTTMRVMTDGLWRRWWRRDVNRFARRLAQVTSEQGKQEAI